MISWRPGREEILRQGEIRMKKVITVIPLILMALPACGGQPAASLKCDAQAWEAVAELYARAVSDPLEFPEWAANNKGRYPAGGAWQRCGMRLAEALMGAALTPVREAEIDEHAASVAGRSGAYEFGPQIAESMRATARDTARLGSWLSEVLRVTPGLLGTDEEGTEDELARFDALLTFEKSEVFTMSRFVWNSLAGSLSPADVVKYRNMTREMSAWLILQFGQAVR
jgi:hypothetical protein